MDSSILWMTGNGMGRGTTPRDRGRGTEKRRRTPRINNNFFTISLRLELLVYPIFVLSRDARVKNGKRAHHFMVNFMSLVER